VSRALIIHHGGRAGRAGPWTADAAQVLQATPVLRVLADHEITWLTSRAAAPLLWGNPLLERVVTSSRQAQMDLAGERFDWVLNLDSTPGACALADRTRARRHAGYTWDATLGRARVRTTPTLVKPLRGRTYQDWLFALIDRRWSGERYVLGYRPRSRVRYDVGLNHLPGPDPRGSWPPSAWSALRRRLQPQFTIGLPVITPSVLDVIDWVHSCRTIVTVNSLGLHAALALGTRVVALLEPAEARAVPLYGQGVAITPPGGSAALRLITPAAVHAAVETARQVRRAG
jgi:heptosyltransferase-2